MFNTMNTVRPRPYPQRGTGNYNAGNDGTDKDGHNSQGQEQQQQNQQVVARGRAEEVAQSQTPVRPAIYSPANNAYPTSYHSQPTSIANTGYNNIQYKQINPQQYQTIQGGYQPIQQPSSIPEPLRPINAKSNKVNIAQILKDFRNTMKAIATPTEIEDEVSKYIEKVEELVRQPNPQVNLIQSNLKIAASLLDKYISETLNKDSKVVQNWLDALFLQRINYSYNEEEINPNFLVQFPSDSERAKQKQVEQKDEVSENTNNIETQTQQEYATETGQNDQVIDIDEYQDSNLVQEYILKSVSILISMLYICRLIRLI